MKHFGTRITAIVLVLVMAASMLPMQVLASSLLENDPAYNREMLDAIKDIVGSEEEAQLYYDLMEHYGEITDFLDAVRDGAVFYAGAFCTQIIHKSCFRLDFVHIHV